MTKYLALWLEGPLQSWGADSCFSARRTLSFPTRSGMTGLLLAAAGASGPQKELLAQLADCPLSVFCFNDEDSPVMTDFHMVGNGYDDKDKWQRRMTPKKADGSAPSGKGDNVGSRLTYRDYLQGRHFAAIWEMDDALCERFSIALLNPVFDVFLGRKCCQPADMVLIGNYDSEQEAMDNIRKRASDVKLPNDKHLHITKKICENNGQSNAERLVLSDVPVQFGLHKVYRERIVYIVKVDVEGEP